MYADTERTVVTVGIYTIALHRSRIFEDVKINQSVEVAAKFHLLRFRIEVKIYLFHCFYDRNENSVKSLVKYRQNAEVG